MLLPELYEKDGMVEVSMADVADGGFVVGAALMNSLTVETWDKYDFPETEAQLASLFGMW